MKIRDLLAGLYTLDPNQDVLCYTEDDDFVPMGHLFRLLDVQSFEVVDEVKKRGEDDIPTMECGKSSESVEYVLLRLTTEF